MTDDDRFEAALRAAGWKLMPPDDGDPIAWAAAPDEMSGGRVRQLLALCRAYAADAVEAAYREGHRVGWDDRGAVWQGRGVPSEDAAWHASRARAALREGSDD